MSLKIFKFLLLKKWGAWLIRGRGVFKKKWYSSFQIIHTKGTINGLKYRPTDCVTQMDICMT
jgi:hypothetical protein